MFRAITVKTILTIMSAFMVVAHGHSHMLSTCSVIRPACCDGPCGQSAGSVRLSDFAPNLPEEEGIVLSPHSSCLPAGVEDESGFPSNPYNHGGCEKGCCQGCQTLMFLTAEYPATFKPAESSTLFDVNSPSPVSVFSASLFRPPQS